MKATKPFAKAASEGVLDEELEAENLSRVLRWYLNNRTGSVDLKPADQSVLSLCLQIAAMTDPKHLADVAKSVSDNPYYNPGIVSLNTTVSGATVSEFWVQRDKSLKENPVDFIRTTYDHLLDGYFTLSDLKKLDLKLYIAYYSWLGRPGNERPSLEELNLPTKKEVNDNLLSEDMPTDVPSLSEILQVFVPSEMRARQKVKDVARKRRWADLNMPKLQA